MHQCPKKVLTKCKCCFFFIYVNYNLPTITIGISNAQKYYTTTAYHGSIKKDEGTLEQVLERLHIHNIEDWYDVPKSHFKFASFKLQKKYLHSLSYFLLYISLFN